MDKNTRAPARAPAHPHAHPHAHPRVTARDTMKTPRRFDTAEDKLWYAIMNVWDKPKTGDTASDEERIIASDEGRTTTSK